MKRIIIFIIIVSALCLLAIRDFNNYFYGKSFINSHLLPYGLTPEYYILNYDIENGIKTYHQNFYLVSDSSECTGCGSSIPTASYNPSFVIDTIKSYYFNKDSIYVYCVDEKHKPHWIIPVYDGRDNSYVVFEETKNVQMESLSKYKCVTIQYEPPKPIQ